MSMGNYAQYYLLEELSDTEQCYNTTDKELLSIYFAVKNCDFYLVGNKFVVYTDHKH